MIRVALAATVLLRAVSPALAGSLGAVKGGDLGHIWIYGDSYNDGAAIQETANARGINDQQLEIHAFSGAALNPGRYATTCTPEGGNMSGTLCNNIIKYQALHHPFTSACSTVQNTINNVDGGAPGGAGCIADQVLSPGDMCIIQSSTNDVARARYNEWAGDFELQQAAALELILDKMDAIGVRCVLATGAPMVFGVSSNGGGEPGSDPDSSVLSWNKAIEDYVIPIYEQAVIDHPNHTFVNVYEVFRDYQTEFGDQALADLYRNCNVYEGVNGSADCVDGTHPGTVVQSNGDSGNTLMFNKIIDALFELNTRRVQNTPIFIGN